MSVPVSVARARRPDWPQQAIVAGFIGMAVAAVVLVVAYSVSQALGQGYTAHNASTFVLWLHNLTRNSVTTAAKDSLYLALLLHIAFGIFWAGVYAYDADLRLSGPGWRKGLIFSLGPWLLSIFVLLPILGAGFLGFGLGAGPLPLIGNLVLHAVYGVVLGSVYGLNALGGTDANGIELGQHNAAERGAAVGIGAGAILGGVCGLAISVFSTGVNGAHADSVLTGPWQLFLFGAALGAVAGALLGSMSGLTNVNDNR